MDTVETDREWAALREQLRTFHITGLGLEEWIPALEPEHLLSGRSLGIAPSAASPLAMLCSALRVARGQARAALLAQIRQAADRLNELLTLDDSHAAETLSEDSITSSLGAGAERYLNTAHIATALRKRSNPVQRMEPERRERCRRAIETLRATITAASTQPALLLFTTTEARAEIPDAHVSRGPDPCGDAVARCRRDLQELEGALRALRVARLELEQGYNPSLHDPILERFRWSAAHAEELAAAVPVIVMLQASEFAALPLSAVTRTLDSGLPLQILVLHHGLDAGALDSQDPDVALLALAHRNAVTVQGTVCAPAILDRQFASIAGCAHTAVAVVGVDVSPSAQVLAETAAWSAFTYQPAPDGTLATGLTLHGATTTGWTPAHAAALDPSLRKHFRLLPAEAEDNEQIELGLYLERYHDRAPLAIPYLPVLDEFGHTRRLAVSRDLADFCHERQQAWRWLKDAATHPAAPAPQPTVAPIGAEDAMRRGAEQAVAQAIKLLTHQEA